MLSSRMSDSRAWFSWFVLWLRLTHNVGSSWFPPQEDVLNDCQYTTRRLTALGLFSVLTLPVLRAIERRVALEMLRARSRLGAVARGVLFRVLFALSSLAQLHPTRR